MIKRKPRDLIVEKDSEEARRVIELMNVSGLTYTLHQIDREEVLRQRKHTPFPLPRLLVNEEYFSSLEFIEYYVKVYGIGGKLYEPDRPEEVEVIDLKTYNERIINCW